MFLESQYSDHNCQLDQGREAGTQGKDPPEEVAVPDVEDEVGHGHRGCRVEADGQQGLDCGEHRQTRQKSNLKQITLTKSCLNYETHHHFYCQQSNCDSKPGCQLGVLPIILNVRVLQRKTGHHVLLPGHQDCHRQDKVGD